jgi:pilus assembly protein CpaE
MGLVAVVDATEEYRGQMTALLGAQADMGIVLVSSAQEAFGVLASEKPFVLLLGPSITPEEAVQLAAVAGKGDAPADVIAVTRRASQDTIRTLFRAGVRDVLDQEVPSGDILSAIREAHERVERVRVTLASASECETSNKQPGRVVTVFSTKGGVGKSVTATNLGVALAARNGHRVALVDLDLQFGDVGIMLGLDPDRTIVDAVQAFDRLDQDMLKGCMTSHDSGLDVLLAPSQPEDAEIITTGRIDHVLGLLRSMYDIVVIDTAAALNETVLAALDRSNEVYAVTMMDVASIKNTRISMQKLAQLGYSADLVKLVLNRADSKVWLQLGEVERAVGARVFAIVARDRVVPRSVNRGVPVVLDAPKSDVAKALASLAEGIARAAEEVKVDVT